MDDKDLELQIKSKLFSHLESLGILRNSGGNENYIQQDKMNIRSRYKAMREDRKKKNAAFIEANLDSLSQYFACGKSINPDSICPRIELVKTKTKESRLFRLATQLWSIPVSEGYGRRMRFLIWDDSNGKLIGLMALGDPVFNLRVRDEWIGWTADDRRKRLIHTLDAYVLGAVPPYSFLLCGKLIACLVRTQPIRLLFAKRYQKTQGIISGEEKKPNLVVVTTSSALGRSSVYNRLKLANMWYFQSIGFTSGYGHYHVPADVFNDMRCYLKIKGHHYHNNHRFGNGPNWRLRTIRAALVLLGLNPSLLNHGIRREVFICRLAKNAEQILRGERKRPDYSDLLTISEVAEMVLERWVRPRARRYPEYADWRITDLEKLLKSS